LIQHRYHRQSLDSKYINSYINIAECAVMTQIVYLVFVIAYSDESLGDDFFIVLQAIDIGLVTAVTIRYVMRIQ
jgi:hypothetical protein